MKKYFLGFIALALAITFSAFTKPAKTTNPKFRYTPTSFSEANVELLTNWVNDETSFSCDGDLTAACSITVTDPKYYHDEEGVPVLNTPTYIAGPHEQNDVAFDITAEQGNGTTGIFRVASTLSGSIDNKAL